MCPISVTTARNQRYPQVHVSEIHTSTQVQPWSLLQTMQPFQDLSSQTMFISVFVFSDRSFSGCVFPDYFLFRRCLFRLYPFQALPCHITSFSTFVFAYYILLRNKWKSHLFFSANLTWIYKTTDIKRKTYETSWHKHLWDTCRNCISTSVLNCSFLTPFHTISGHLIGHLIFQHKTQKHLKKYLLYWSILYKI